MASFSWRTVFRRGAAADGAPTVAPVGTGDGSTAAFVGASAAATLAPPGDAGAAAGAEQGRTSSISEDLIERYVDVEARRR